MPGVNTIDLTKTVFSTEIDNGNGGSSITIDWTSGNFQKLTLDSSSCTVSFIPPTSLRILYFKVIQGSGGNKLITLPSNVNLKANNAILSTVEGTVDQIEFYFDGSDYWGQILRNYT